LSRLDPCPLFNQQLDNFPGHLRANFDWSCCR
jgi:hypothetical protein